MDFKAGDLITNGSQAGDVIGPDPKGLKIANIALNSPYGGNAGMTQVLPLYVLGSWSKVTVGEWFGVLGAPTLRQRYVWSPDYSHLVREVAAGVSS